MRRVLVLGVVSAALMGLSAHADRCERYEVSISFEAEIGKIRRAADRGETASAFEQIENLRLNNPDLNCSELHLIDAVEATAHVVDGNWAKAVESGLRSVDNAPLPLARRMLAELYFLLQYSGDAELAKTVLWELAEVDGNMGPYESYEIAQKYMDTGDIGRAIRYAESAFVQLPGENSQELLTFMLDLYERNGASDYADYFRTKLKRFQPLDEADLKQELEAHWSRGELTEAYNYSARLFEDGLLTSQAEYVSHFELAARVEGYDKTVQTMRLYLRSGFFEDRELAVAALEEFVDRFEPIKNELVMVQEAEPMAPPQPQYPLRAAKEGIEGYCEMVFAVDKGGIPFNMLTFCNDPIFKDPSETAVAASRFEPRMVNGKATDRHNVVYPISYNLE